ncbi:VOC family protein [Pleionea sediminis]|uniref:VOC family protein n=1 Tax=Pleionea sediminis TaxID=2569479 RepID=UPI0011868EBF|nr:VOC family protein [Pleionea sediminis]
MLKQLATNVLYVNDIEQAKQWVKEVLDLEPYFDEPFYVGYNISGFELGLLPGERKQDNNSVSYWRVDNIDEAVALYKERGAELAEPVEDVGDGIRVAALADPFGNYIGMIENPHFKPEI